MNTLSLILKTRPGAHASRFLDFVVDGRPFSSHVPQAVGFDVSVLVLDWPNRSIPIAAPLLGIADPDLPPDRVALYVCGQCGDIGCGALTARLTMAPDTVTWDAFRYEVNYEEGPKELFGAQPLVFDRRAYEELLEGVQRPGAYPPLLQSEDRNS